jgi:predicted porin
MKKTLVALAALAAVGAASAQVTVYGKADLGVSSTTKTGATDQGLEVTSGNYETSRFGVKASHDLSGGMKALAQYEFSVDATGGSDAIKSNRVASLGLTGGFGTVTMGLQWTPYDSAWGFDQLEYNGFSAAGKTWYNGAHGDNGNGGNGNAKKSIAYTTPDMSGFNATVLFSNSADKTDTTTSVPYVGLGANYTAGPLSINFGYEQVASTAHLGAPSVLGVGVVKNPNGAMADEKTTASIIGASYNLGVATVGVGFQQANVDARNTNGAAASFKDAGYTLSVSFPVSSATTLALGYAAETTTSAGLTDGKSTGFGAQVIYSLTKQAAVYGGAFQTKVDAVGPASVGQPEEILTTKYAAGVRYNF